MILHQEARLQPELTSLGVWTPFYFIDTDVSHQETFSSQRLFVLSRINLNVFFKKYIEVLQDAGQLNFYTLVKIFSALLRIVKEGGEKKKYLKNNLFFISVILGKMNKLCPHMGRDIQCIRTLLNQTQYDHHFGDHSRIAVNSRAA